MAKCFIFHCIFGDLDRVETGVSEEGINFLKTFPKSSKLLRRVKTLIVVCGRVPWLYQYWPGEFMLFVVLCPGTPKGSTGSGSGFKASQKTGQRLKVSSDRLGEAGNRTCDPWFTRHRFIPYTTAAS